MIEKKITDLQKSKRKAILKCMEDTGAILVSAKPEDITHELGTLFTAPFHINCKMELNPTTKKESAMIPLYTEEMKKNDINPIVGSTVILAIQPRSYGISEDQYKHNGSHLEVIATCHGLAVLMCSDTKFTIAVNNAHYKPLPKALSGWVNVYNDNNKSTHSSRINADQYAIGYQSVRKACIDLSQHNEGEGI